MNETSARIHGAESRVQISRVTGILRRAQALLHGGQGRSPTFFELQQWTGVAEGTIKDWFAGRGRPTAEFLVQLLERTSEASRHEVLDCAYRVCPTLDHPRLNRDRTAVSLLNTIVRRPKGLIFIQGGNDEHKTFLATAMGHSFLRLTARPHVIAGIDIHEPDWFVPVPGVVYLHNIFGHDQLREAVHAHWPRLRPNQNQLILLNGIWPVAAEFQPEIRNLTGSGCVVLTNGGPIKPSLLKKMTRDPVHILTVSKDPDNLQRISVGIEVV